MARRIRLPWIVDLALVDDPAEIAALAHEPRLDRDFVKRCGPLVNRALTGRIRRWLQVDGRPLPALAPRGDPVRAASQGELERALTPDDPSTLWDPAAVADLARFVRGERQAPPPGPVVQQIVGRLFFKDYAATSESYAAAQLIDRLGGAKPWQLLFWSLTGRIARARRLVWRLGHDDRHAIHGTAIAMHNMVRALDRMRAIFADPAQRDALGPDAAVARALVAPPRVIRQATGGVETAAAGRLRPGTLVLFELDAARLHAPGPPVTFMTESWARCPAHAFVPALLHAVWLSATREG
jgi:hypothetical protein